VPFWGCVDTASLLGSQIAKKNKFGGVNRHFAAKRTKYSNFRITKTTEVDSNQILSHNKDLQVLLVGGPKMRQIQDSGQPP